jgi:hypothetical protein
VILKKELLRQKEKVPYDKEQNIVVAKTEIEILIGFK